MLRYIWIVYAIILLVAIPWYWPSDTDTLLLGLPLWVFISLIAAIFWAILTAFLILFAWNPHRGGD